MTHQPGVYVPLRALFLVVIINIITFQYSVTLEPRHEKTNILHMQKQRRMPASR